MTDFTSNTSVKKSPNKQLIISAIDHFVFIREIIAFNGAAEEIKFKKKTKTKLAFLIKIALYSSDECQL